MILIDETSKLLRLLGRESKLALKKTYSNWSGLKQFDTLGFDQTFKIKFRTNPILSIKYTSSRLWIPRINQNLNRKFFDSLPFSHKSSSTSIETPGTNGLVIISETNAKQTLARVSANGWLPTCLIQPIQWEDYLYRIHGFHYSVDCANKI